MHSQAGSCPPVAPVSPLVHDRAALAARGPGHRPPVVGAALVGAGGCRENSEGEQRSTPSSRPPRSPVCGRIFRAQDPDDNQRGRPVFDDIADVIARCPMARRFAGVGAGSSSTSGSTGGGASDISGGSGVSSRPSTSKVLPTDRLLTRREHAVDRDGDVDREAADGSRVLHAVNR